MKNRKIGRLFVLGFDGLDVPGEALAFAERFGLGGLILFRRNCPAGDTVRALVSNARARLSSADPGGTPLVLVDQEGGRVERILDGVPHLPPARELGAAGEAGVERAAEGQARALRALGIDVNLAPVCDVLQGGESGVIGDRSYGEDPMRVGALAAAFVRGSLRGGIIPCAKHFPGHGAARIDSHKGLPVLEKPLAEWEAVDLPPFAAAVAAGVALVMSAHLVCPSLSAGPATLCHSWLTGILRGRLGFTGAVVTDDLEMGALDGLGAPPEIALRAHRAGADLLLYGRMLRPQLDVWHVAETLERELADDELSRALQRIAALRSVPG